MEDVLGSDRLGADPTLGEGDVGGHFRIEVVTDHDHVEQLGQGIHAVGQRRVGRAGKHVEFAGDLEEVRRVAAARAFAVVRVDRPALEGGDRVFDEPGFVQSVGVDRHRDVVLVGDPQHDRIAAGVVP